MREKQEIRGGASVARARALIDVAMLMSQDRSNPERPYRDARISIGTVSGGEFHAGLSFATGSPDIAYAAKPAIEMIKCRKLSSVLIGMIPRIASPLPIAKPQIATIR